LKTYIGIFLFLLGIVFSSQAQIEDTTQLSSASKKKIYSRPRRAAFMSAALPGLGQAYNKKYWKIPIVYAGLGGLGYFFIKNQSEFDYYRINLKAEYDSDAGTVNTSGLSGEVLLEQKTTYRRRRDLTGFGLGLVYILNIIDANIDAHLKTFDVSDNLSLNIKPKTEVISFRGETLIVSGLGIKFIF
jgi:hypothetical protein